MTEIVYPTQELIPSFHQCLKQVAAERVYLEMTEPPPIERVTNFQLGLIAKDGAVFYAVDNGRVVGWCDVFPEDNPRQSHRGSLGMGILASHRRQGIGSRLMDAVLKKAKASGLEKVELNVYTTNENAIQLYRKMGFIEEGLIKNYRKLDGRTYDSMMMAKFL